MRHKMTRRFTAYLLILTFFFCNILPSHAASVDPGVSLSDSGNPAKEDSGIRAAEYTLTTEQSRIHFGSLEQNSLVSAQSIVLANEGSGNIELLWYESDRNDCITVDAPDNFSLAPGESRTFTVSANTSLAPGTYSAFLLFGDLSDPYFEHGVQVDLSLEIRKPVQTAPVIRSVSISPATTVAAKNSTCRFTASVTGENNFSREVAWSVAGQLSGNTFIDAGGILNIASDETSTALIVKAVSRQDSAHSATALVSLLKSSYFIQVNASPDNGGSVYGSGVVEEGGYVLLTAAPHNGFVFEGWSLDNRIVSTNSQFVADNIRNNRTYTAVFKPVSCRININTNNSNAGTVTESRTVGFGESITLEAVPKDGYRFDSWVEDNAVLSRDASFSLNNITKSHDITAVFTQSKFSLTLGCSPADSGTVSGQGTYERGNSIKITAVPKSGYRFAGWFENGIMVNPNPEYTVNEIDRDRNLVAAFEMEGAVIYTITASASTANGTVTPEGRTTITQGSGILYTITPKDGYSISTVYIDGISIGPVSSYSFTDVRNDHSITADFAELPKPADSGSSSGKSPNPEPEDTGGIDTSFLPEGPKNRTNKQPEENKTEVLTGTLQYLNTSVADAERLIDEKNDRELLSAALQTGDLQVTIHNDFADNSQETFSGSFYDNSSVKNFEIAVDYILNRNHKIEMLLGKRPVAINFHIDRTDGEELPETVEFFEENKIRGMQIGQFFEVSLMESSQKETQMYTRLPQALKIVLNLPEHLKEENRKFYILRMHTNEDGSQEFAELVDEDKDPDTITFSTDRFSPYAIAYIDLQSGGKASSATVEPTARSWGNDSITSVILVLAIILATSVTGALILFIRKRRRT